MSPMTDLAYRQRLRRLTRGQLWDETDVWLAQMRDAKYSNDPDGAEFSLDRYNAVHDELDRRDAKKRPRGARTFAEAPS